ncbi:MAG: glycoside hydrolase family 65 protein [Lentisphaerae bacterium]|nr:glycoside hydrolase family 65 protein [Lentisphaerota bacterium]
MDCTGGNWILTQEGFDIATAQAFEGLFTVGSGTLHTRASLEEHFADCPQDSRELRRPANVTAEKFVHAPGRWGTFVPGVFGHHPLLLQEMINLPWFLELTPVVDGERLDLTASNVQGFRRTLNMRTATLSRELAWQTKSGKTLRVLHERFISGCATNLSVQRMRIECDQAVELTILGGIDARVTTNGFDHFRLVEIRETAGGVTCRVVTDAEDTIGMETRLTADGAVWTYGNAERHGWRQAVVTVQPGRPLVVEKRTAVTTSRDPASTTPAAVLDCHAGASWDDLRRRHCAHWAGEWERADIRIEGDDESQIILRSSIYHLLRAHVPGDGRVAICAKGYAGDAYKGHFFWDTEAYLLPFFLYTAPEKARTFIDFRIGNLAEAQKIAASYGCRGARFPWESDADGRECCCEFQYRDHEIHVTGAVAHGVAHYFSAVGGVAQASDAAARLAVETARYWMDRIDYRKGETSPSILGVMGPDEYAPITHNNAYTNRMAAFNLAFAARVGRRGGATDEECAAFARTAAALPILRSRKNPELVLQCEGFESLAESRFDEFWADRKGCYAARVSQERLYRSKNLKQADVILLMAMFPDEFTDAEVKAAWETYLPVTTHDSSLSAAIHAIVALRLGLFDEAWTFFRKSAAIDLDTDHGGAAQGIHIAGAAGNWQVLVLGFAGMRTALQSNVLSFNPKLPAHWTKLAFPIVWKGTPVHVEMERGRTKVTNRGSQTLDISVAGRIARVAPGECGEW